jgi:hypothetical protein
VVRDPLERGAREGDSPVLWTTRSPAIERGIRNIRG